MNQYFFAALALFSFSLTAPVHWWATVFSALVLGWVAGLRYCSRSIDAKKALDNAHRAS